MSAPERHVAERVRVRVTFSFDGEVDEDLQSWLITALSGIGATDIDVQQIEGCISREMIEQAEQEAADRTWGSASDLRHNDGEVALTD